jgi:tetratricopeptide (TPR) repeat protein
MLKKCLFVLIAVAITLMGCFVLLACWQSQTIRRDPSVLMTTYYRLKTTNPSVAKAALLLALKQNPDYLPALKEGSQWYVKAGDLASAQPLLERLHGLLPDDDGYAYQLAYSYYEEGNWYEARHLFLVLSQSASARFRQQAQQALTAMASFVSGFADLAVVERMPVFHSVAPFVFKTKDKLQPHRITHTLKELAYRALHFGQHERAIAYLKRDYAATHQPDVAMQLGYLYEHKHDMVRAYRFFQHATQSRDTALALRAQRALTQLSGLQMKAMPTPYYGEVFFNPFSQSRFGLTVTPFLARAGVEQDNPLQTKEYVFLRRTSDNRSENLGQLSQIYEDNVEILGVGGQVKPMARIPAIAFVEAGNAYDLVYQDRDRWRGDLRAGLMYYQDFGCQPSYYDRLTWGHAYYSDWYADATYFTRYNNNVIAGVRTRQGIRLLQYHSSMLNLYWVGRAITDTNRIFYNNFAEMGPGLALVPSNRFNVQVRLEHVNGVYLPAGTVPPNPYSKHYTNNLIQMLFYIRV